MLRNLGETEKSALKQKTCGRYWRIYRMEK